MKRVTRILSFGAWAFALYWIAAGTSAIYNQTHRLSGYRPIKATILSSEVRRESRRELMATRTVYKPHIRYAYEIDGSRFESAIVSIHKGREGQEWAQDLVQRYQVGSEAVAYYNPQKPAEAFLAREYLFSDTYGFLLLGTGVTCFALVFMVLSHLETRESIPIPLLNGGFELRPEASRKSRLWLSIVVTASWHVVGLFACVHFMCVAAKPYPSELYLSTGVYEGIGFLPVACAVYYGIVMTCIGEAHVIVDRAHFFPGDKIRVVCEQQIKRTRTIKQYTVRLICERHIWVKENRKESSRKDLCYVKNIMRLQRSQDIPDETLATKHDVQIPIGHPPSSPRHGKIYPNVPRYYWFFEVLASVKCCPTYKAKFPITVERET